MGSLHPCLPVQETNKPFLGYLGTLSLTLNNTFCCSLPAHCVTCAPSSAYIIHTPGLLGNHSTTAGMLDKGCGTGSMGRGGTRGKLSPDWGPTWVMPACLCTFLGTLPHDCH